MKMGATQYCVCGEGKHSIENAKRLGLLGVEPFFGASDNWLLNTSDQERRDFRDRATEYDVAIPSTALGAFNGDSAIVEADGYESAMALIERSLDFTRDVGASVMLLCTYIQSHPDTEQKKDNLLKVVRDAEPLARERGIRIALEAPLYATELRDLARAAESDHVGVYYDTGNAIALGFDPVEEIVVLDDLIMAVHIKDSIDQLGGLHLGEGHVDHAAAIQAIKGIGYDGWLMLETPGGDLNALRDDIECLQRYLV